MNYLVVILGALALGAYYYLVFLLLAPILILIENPMPRPNIKWIAVPVLFNVLLNIIHPMYTSLENKEYCIQANAIIKITAQVETDLLKQEQPKKYFIENNIGPASVTQGNNCRMLLFEPTRMIIFDSVAVGDKIAITTTKKLNQFLGHQKERNTVDFEIDKVREPVKGKLSIKSLYRQRTDSLGLWMLTAKEI